MTTKPPIITASLLAEYCYATAPRRRAILELMHREGFEPFKLWYGAVPGAYRHYVASQCQDGEKLSALEAQLIVREARTDDEDQKALKQLDALEHIRLTDHSDLLATSHAASFDHGVRTLEIAGVTIRVSPTNLLTSPRLGHIQSDVGVLKPYLKSGRTLPDDEGRLFASILHWFAEVELGHLGEASSHLCAVSDIFAQKLHFAPTKTAKARSVIEANCSEISDRWHSFTPRVPVARRAKQ
ncbi:hypothetical protein [Devosia sp.]|uniref:hypothetical protein n=1 Tax=Devosia sp. TaxID=1871048 RepID=UPI002FC99B12